MRYCGQLAGSPGRYGTPGETEEVLQLADERYRHGEDAGGAGDHDPVGLFLTGPVMPVFHGDVMESGAALEDVQCGTLLAFPLVDPIDGYPSLTQAGCRKELHDYPLAGSIVLVA